MEDISRDLLADASQGNMEAFEQVYKAVSGFVYNVALRINRNSADAEEVTQDVFMKIWRSLKTFQYRASFKTWVYRIAVNTAINKYRKSAKDEKGRIDYESIANVLPDTRMAYDSITHGEDEAKLNALLGILSPEYRVCLVLREIEGLSYREIAASLVIPVNTVRSRLKRAREALLGEARRGLAKDAL